MQRRAGIFAFAVAVLFAWTLFTLPAPAPTSGHRTDRAAVAGPGGGEITSTLIGVQKPPWHPYGTGAIFAGVVVAAAATLLRTRPRIAPATPDRRRRRWRAQLTGAPPAA